tara:strand:+ start:37100 stop:37807 length:708 start_codon:yes stop_codon:yes gene_type:complete
MINNLYLFTKALLFWIIFASTTILLSFLLIFCRLFGYMPALYIAKLWAWISIISLKYICGISYKVDGLEKLTKRQNLIFSKHQSTWETIFFLLIIPKPIFIVKRELMYVPFFGWCLFLLKNISIDRENGSSAIKKMITETDKLYNNGFSIIIFPEGTRVAVDAKTEIKQGGIIMSKKLQLPILPVTHNAGLYWPRHSFLKYSGQIHMLIGNLINVSDINASKMEIEVWMDKKLDV